MSITKRKYDILGVGGIRYYMATVTINEDWFQHAGDFQFKIIHSEQWNNTMKGF